MAIDCQHSWYRRPLPSGALSPLIPENSVSVPVEHPTQTTETCDTGASQADLADPVSQPGSSDVQILDSHGTLIPADPAAAESPAPSPPASVPLFSDQPSVASVSGVPSVSDSVLGLVPSMPEDLSAFCYRQHSCRGRYASGIRQCGTFCFRQRSGLS